MAIFIWQCFLQRLKKKKLQSPRLECRRHSFTEIKTNRVEEIKLQAIPLGGPADFKYPKRETSLSKGDTLLLMSDGFPELFNNQKEILDYSRAKEIFGSIGDSVCI